MPRSANKELFFGLMVGTAGLTLLLVWYHRGRKPRTKFDSMSLPARVRTHKTLRSSPDPQGMFQDGQLKILDKLDELVAQVEALAEEVRGLRAALPKLEEFRRDGLGGRTALSRISPQHRARKKQAAQGQQQPNTSNSSEDAESEGGYLTANTDTEDQHFPTTRPLSSPVEELALEELLQKADSLRTDEAGKMESFELLCDHKEKFSDEIEFIWRLVRAYGDMCELSTNVDEKRYYANFGKTLGERAVSSAPENGRCHLWYAVLCGLVSEFEGLQNKISNGQCFKKHLDIAIQLLPEEPFLYYLRGRYCYTVSQLSWLERKMVTTLFGMAPNFTVLDARNDFLKAEELKPGFSKCNYAYLAKCYLDLEDTCEALKFCDQAKLLPSVSREDEVAQAQIEEMLGSLSRT